MFATGNKIKTRIKRTNTNARYIYNQLYMFAFEQERQEKACPHKEFKPKDGENNETGTIKRNRTYWTYSEVAAFFMFSASSLQ